MTSRIEARGRLVLDDEVVVGALSIVDGTIDARQIDRVATRDDSDLPY
ncbi:MAG: hypothetical protein QOI00_2180, partial [Chloroflexota bacterium]|nr:hypothetical protein [Chloroflexota bacterium]